MSLYKRKEDGKWRVQISYKDKEGRYRHISRTARTRKEAVALEAALRSQMNGSTDPHTTLNAVAIATPGMTLPLLFVELATMPAKPPKKAISRS